MSVTRDTAIRCLVQLQQLCPSQLQQPLTYFHSSELPNVPLSDAAVQIMENLAKTGLNDSMLIWASILVKRFEHYAQRPVDAFMVHRMYLAALWIVIKLHSDVAPRAKTYAHMCGMQTWELPRLELALLIALDFNTFVSAAELENQVTHG